MGELRGPKLTLLWQVGLESPGVPESPVYHRAYSRLSSSVRIRGIREATNPGHRGSARRLRGFSEAAFGVPEMARSLWAGLLLVFDLVLGCHLRAPCLLPRSSSSLLLSAPSHPSHHA